MQRIDTKREGGYEANYNAGWVTTDESTVELSGTRAEADIIVSALELLVMERKKLRLLGVKVERSVSGGPYYRAQYASAEEVLESIKAPNYTELTTE